MMIIDHTRFHADRVLSTPFTWAQFTRVFRIEYGWRLAATFPSDRLTLRTSSKRSDKTYSVRALTVSRDGEFVGGALPEIWRWAITELSDPAFATTVRALSGVAASHTSIEIRLTEYGHGHSMSPHTDRSDKLVTLVFYLGQDWQSGDGGELAILRSAAADDVYSQVSPKLGVCAMIVRSPDSWHCVETPNRSDSVRQCVLVHYYTMPGGERVDADRLRSG